MQQQSTDSNSEYCVNIHASAKPGTTEMLTSSIRISDIPQTQPNYERQAVENPKILSQKVDKNYVSEKQVSTFWENIAVEISTILSYLSGFALGNAAHRWLEIQNELHRIIENNIYNRCNINKDVREGGVDDGATLGTEATSYTTFLVIIAFGLLIPTGFTKLIQMLSNRKDSKTLHEKLKEFHFKIRSRYFDVNSKQIQAILDNIRFSENDLKATIENINFSQPSENEVRMEEVHRLQENAERELLETKNENIHSEVMQRIQTLEVERTVLAEAITQEQFLWNDYNRSKVKFENLQVALQIQFGEMNQADLRRAAKQLNEENLAAHLFPKLDIPTTLWQRFCNQTQWFRGELGRYMKPIAMVFAIPGIIQTIRASQQISASTGCDMSVVFTDKCGAVQEVDLMSQEIWIWMWVSFPLLFFYALFTFLNGITYPFKSFESLRNWIYEKIHAPYERWCTNEDRWFYKELVWRAVSPILLSATMIFSIWRSIEFADRYAFLVGCESLANTIKLTYQDADSLECSAATRGMIIATFVGACEIGKFYLLYVAEFFGVYGLTHILEKIIDFKKRIDKDAANAAMDEFLDQDSTSLKLAGASIFLSGAANLIPSKKLGDRLLHQGIKVVTPLPSLNETIANLDYYTHQNDTSAFFKTICPEDDFVSLMNETLRDVHLPQNITINTILDFLNKTSTWKSPVVIINNNTLIYTLAEACLDTGLITSLFMNILENDPNCNEFNTIRALAAAIAFFYANASITGATTLFFSSIVLRVNYFCKKLCCYQSNVERSTEEATSIPVTITHDTDEKKNNLTEPLLDSNLRSVEREAPSRMKRLWNWLSRKNEDSLQINQDFKHSESYCNFFNKKAPATRPISSETPSQSLSGYTPPNLS